jgi:hypothetical protein
LTSKQKTKDRKESGVELYKIKWLNFNLVPLGNGERSEGPLSTQQKE